MGDYLKGNKFSTTYKQVVCIGAADTRDGILATTQAEVWTDNAADGKNLFPFTAATDAMQMTSTKRLEFNDDAVYIHSSTDSQLNLVADGEVDITAGSLDVNSSGGIAIDGTTVSIDGTGASNFSVAGADLTLATTSSGNIMLSPVGYLQVANGKKLQFADSGEYISGDTTNLTIASGADINLTATADINIPVNIGLRFGDGGENIETDNTDFTVTSGGKINLTATTDVVIPTNVGLQFTDANEKIESDGADLTINAGTDINLTATGDVNIPSGVGVTFGSAANPKIEGDGTDLAIDVAGNINVTSTVNEANSIYLRANAGTSETIKIHADQGTSVTEGAASLSLLSDAGGVELRSTANLANAINLTVDSGTTSSMTLYNDTGSSVTDEAASIQLLSDAGGIGIASKSGLANAIYLHANGGGSETIKVHADQGTGAASIELTSDAGGIGINSSATGKSLDINTAILDLDATEASNITMTTNAASTTNLTIEASNSNGSNDSDIIVSTDGVVHLRSNDTTNTYAGAGIQIGTDLSGVDVAIGHTTSDVRIGDNLLVTGDGTVSGDLTVTGALTYGSVALSNQEITGSAPYLTFTNNTEENTDPNDASGASSGRESRLVFKGEKGDGTAHELGTILVGHSGTGDDKKGQFQFFVNSGALSDGALFQAMTIIDTGAVGIGTSSPGENLHVTGTGEQEIKVTSSDNDAVISIDSDTDEGQDSKLLFSSGGTDRGEIVYDNNVTAASQKMQFKVGDNAVTAMTILGDGKVGIGASSPQGKLHVGGTESNTSDDTDNLFLAEGTGIEFMGSASNNGYGFKIESLDASDGSGTHNLKFFSRINDATWDTDVLMQINASASGSLHGGVGIMGAPYKAELYVNGNVGINNNDPNARLSIVADTDAERAIYISDADSGCDTNNIMMRLDYSNDDDLDGAMFIEFQDSDGNLGEISGNGTATTYATSSDYRLKTDFKDIVDATGTINKLKLYDFAWKRNTNKRSMGVIAHEAQEIVPTAITGVKDAMTTKEYIDENGINQTKEVNKNQQADYSKFVPLLLKSIQELSAKVVALENA